jgi:hypothetical protein
MRLLSDTLRSLPSNLTTQGAWTRPLESRRLGVGFESTTVLTAPKRYFCCTPNNGRDQSGPVGPFSANNGPTSARNNEMPNYANSEFAREDGRFGRMSQSSGGRCNVAEGVSPNNAL